MAQGSCQQHSSQERYPAACAVLPALAPSAQINRHPLLQTYLARHTAVVTHQLRCRWPTMGNVLLLLALLLAALLLRLVERRSQVLALHDGGEGGKHGANV